MMDRRDLAALSCGFPGVSFDHGAAAKSTIRHEARHEVVNSSRWQQERVERSRSRGQRSPGRQVWLTLGRIAGPGRSGRMRRLRGLGVAAAENARPVNGRAGRTSPRPGCRSDVAAHVDSRRLVTGGTA